MTKLLYIFLLPWSMIAYASQAQAFSDFPGDSTVEIFSKKGKIGMKNEKGNILLEPNYQALGWSDARLKNSKGFLGFKQNELWGLMTNNFEIISHPQYNSLIPFDDDLFIISQKSKYSKVLFYGLIKANGKVKIKPSYRNIYPAGSHLVAATKKEKDIYYGIINSSGKIMVPFNYFHIAALGNDNFTLTKNNGEKDLIKLGSKPHSLFTSMDSVSTFRDGVAIIFKNGKQGLIRQDGKILLPIEYKKIEWNNGKQIYVTPLDQWTILNQKGIEMGSQKADSIFYLNDSLLVKNTSSFAQIYNTNDGESKEVFHADIIGVFGDHFILNKTGQIYIVDDNKNVISEKFTGEVFWNEHFFVAKKKIYQGFEYITIDTKGKSITAQSYMFSDNAIALKVKSNWGIYDQSLQEIIPPLYQKIERNGQHYIVNFKGQFGVIDQGNNWVIPPQYREINAIDNKYYKTVDKYLREFISDGNEKYEASLYYDFYEDFVVEQDVEDFFRLIEKNGNAITDFRKGKYNGHGKSGIIFKNGNQHFLLNAAGKELFKINEYDSVIVSEDEFLPIQKNGSWGFIDRNGILRIANRYDTVRSFHNDRAAIKIRNSWGFINRTEELVIQPYYSEVSDFQNNTAFVQLNNKYGLVDVSGDFIIEAEYDEIKMKKGFYLLRKASKWGIANKSGKVISYPNYSNIYVGDEFIRVEKYGTTRILSENGTTLIDSQFDDIFFDEERKLFLAKKAAKKEQVFLTDILSGNYP
ncbi:WG repeat-containing protein [Marivirga sericea]|nr:WG repeat-containing protein [Marivirga sericea]